MSLTTSETRSEELVVKPREAWRLLSCGNTHGYRLLATGELESFLDGRSRKITMDSIRRYIRQRLLPTDGTSTKPPLPRGRGRPHKLPQPETSG